MLGQRRPVVIAGPTASGKSALALALAERDNGCLINSDASQVYRCWRVLTARPDERDLARAPHRLYGHVPCDVRYSVGTWLREVPAALEAARSSGQRPIIVGGTGLYLSALTEGLAEIPEIPPEVRVRSEELLRSGRGALMLETLARDDPATFTRIDRGNPLRVQRAWEVLVGTGRGLSDWHGSTPPALVPRGNAVRIILSPRTGSLNKAIADRFRSMLEQGALAEVRAYCEAGFDADVPSGRILGASQLIDYLSGRVSLEDAVEASVVATRQFAKRQRTWFRNRLRDWVRVDPAVSDVLEAIPRD